MCSSQTQVKTLVCVCVHVRVCFCEYVLVCVRMRMLVSVCETELSMFPSSPVLSAILQTLHIAAFESSLYLF